MATLAFPENGDHPEPSMRSSAEMGAAGTVRTTNPEHWATMHLVQGTSVAHETPEKTFFFWPVSSPSSEVSSHQRQYIAAHEGR